jgi:hypothetical protein
MLRRLVCITPAIVLALTLSSLAQQEIYDNGPTNGTVDAWAINAGFITSDTFTLNYQFSVSSLTFAAWLYPGDVIESAEVSITSSEFGGTTFFDGVVSFTQSNCTTNQYGFSLCDETGEFRSVMLNSGTYWLNLQNAVLNADDPVYWDENSGPSSASQNSVGTIPSESFTLEGPWCMCGCSNRPDCEPPPTSPEPSSLTLSLSGVTTIFGALAAFRRRIF